MLESIACNEPGRDALGVQLPFMERPQWEPLRGFSVSPGGACGVIALLMDGRLYLWGLWVPLGPIAFFLTRPLNIGMSALDDPPIRDAPRAPSKASLVASEPVSLPAPVGPPGVGTRPAKHLHPAFDDEIGGVIEKPSVKRKTDDFLVGLSAVVIGLVFTFALIYAAAISSSQNDRLAPDATASTVDQSKLVDLSPPAIPVTGNAGMQTSASHRGPEEQPTHIVYVNGTAERRYLGIYEEPVVTYDGRPGMMVSYVQNGSPAEKAGLRIGDVLRSANDLLTRKRGDLNWIIAKATPGSSSAARRDRGQGWRRSRGYCQHRRECASVRPGHSRAKLYRRPDPIVVNCA